MMQNGLKRALVVVLLAFLSGCFTFDGVDSPKVKQAHRGESPRRVMPQEKDGPPQAGFIPALFQPAKPKFEAFSRYGNPATYRVAGKTYRVMRSAQGYKERGVASWYGTKFHSQRTSSGEGYNMYAMTAAHRTLPLPSYVKVKNLRNGKEVIVKVNDRGPFHSSRLIDLSYAAANKLGLLPHGTAPVEVTAVNVAPAGKKQVAHYYVQAGAFVTAKSANDLKNKVRKITRNRIVVEHYKRHYIVKVGPFANKAASDTFKKQLVTKGMKGAFSVLG